jgi:serine/threonine protein kinase
MSSNTSEVGMWGNIKSDTALVTLLKLQLDNNLDHNCLPLGIHGAYGSLFKITCEDYGYTLVGKGTTSELWEEISLEREIYWVLRKAQRSAIPVFLGTINLAKIYFLHSVGRIRHLLLMAIGGGNSISKLEQSPKLQREIWKSKKEIQALGVRHEDLRLENILWDDELQRALIIDFHRSKLDPRPTGKRAKKRPLGNIEEAIPLKRPRILSTE